MAKRDFSISVDVGYLDIGAIAELSDNRGMMYQSPQDRDQFFREAYTNPRSIPYGAALSHAKGVTLGIWGSEESLYADCVKIMAAEFQRIEVEHGIELTITEDELRDSMEFRRAYDIARAPKQAAIHNLARMLGDNSEELPYAEAMITREDVQGLKRLHHRVYTELRGSHSQKKERPAKDYDDYTGEDWRF
ncbi:MAG: hypothetical protein Q7S55_04245 [Nanoarchaeota archaeon]|nr:hypothetical protein [Nanoarchaeota archaeon]